MTQRWGTLIAAALVVGGVPAAAVTPVPAQAVEAVVAVVAGELVSADEGVAAGEVGGGDTQIPPIAELPETPLTPGADPDPGTDPAGDPDPGVDPAPEQPAEPGVSVPTEPGNDDPAGTSEPDPAPAPIAAPVVVPSIAGTPTVGATLRAQPGDWGAPDLSLTYQWLRDGKAIPGAVHVEYALRAEDAAQPLTVRVTAHRAEVASRSADALPLTVQPGTLTAGTVSVHGTARVGHTVAAQLGTWKPAGARFSYQWQRNGTAVSGATAAKYTLTARDAQQRISVKVIATVPGYTPRTVASGVIGPVAAGTLTTAAPRIAGTTTVGKTLTARTAAWRPGTPKLTHQWKRNGTAIPKATGASYTLVSGDAGKRIAVTVTGTLSGYTTATKTSAQTAAVLRPLTGTPTPQISGTARVGAKLRAAAGSWKPGGVTLSYQWFRGGSAIPGATQASYTPVRADAGAKLTVRVTGSKSGYAKTAKTSAAQAIPKVLRAAQPQIAGPAVVGAKLTVQRGTWTAGTASATQWYRSGTAIPKATGASYTLQPADRGHTLTVSVRGTLRGYAAESRTSARTGTVRYPASTRPTGLWNCPAWAPIKGNASTMISHVPGGAFYTRTMPEECFVSAAAAQRAGYRASKR